MDTSAITEERRTMKRYGEWAALADPTILGICFRAERPVLDKEFAVLKEGHDRVDYRLWEAIPNKSCLHRFAGDRVESLLPVQE